MFYDVVAMLLTYSIISGTAEWKLNTKCTRIPNKEHLKLLN